MKHTRNVRRGFVVALGGVVLLFAGAMSIMAQPDPFYAFRRQRNAPVANSDAIRETVIKLSSQYSPRDYNHRNNLNAIAKLIHSELSVAGWETEDQHFTAQGFDYVNVVGRLGKHGGERIVLGAHYDAYGEFPAADDNATGVAGLLELARLLAKAPPALDVELVAYTLEEPPFFGDSEMGSAQHAARLARENVKVRAMISLEMLGFFSEAPGTQFFPMPLMYALYPSRGNFIAVVGNLDNLRLCRKIKQAINEARLIEAYSLNGPAAIAGVDFSDHRSYWKHGFPGAMVTDTAFFRNRAYHTAGDTADRLDYQRIGAVVASLAVAVSELSESSD